MAGRLTAGLTSEHTKFDSHATGPNSKLNLSPHSGHNAKMPFRLLVNDKDQAVAFYRDLLGFAVQEEWGPAFAILSKGSETLWISGPQTSAAKPMPDGRQPEPGGWNRVVIEVEDFDASPKAPRSGLRLSKRTHQRPWGNPSPR